MNYCINYYGKEIELFNTIDEINIDSTHTKNLKRDLEEFCTVHKNQRINLIIDDYQQALDKEWIPFIFDFQQEHKEFKIYIRFPYMDEEYYPALKEKYKEMKFYLNIYVKDWDTLQGLIKEGVSDIFIVEEMGFDLKRAAAVAQDNHVHIRVFPNVAQSSWKSTPAAKKFWIRPEDLHYYEEYIDTCEFYGTNEQQQIFYNIYVNDKKWVGDLNDLIIDLNEEVYSMCLLPRFGEKRVYCNHRCLKGEHCQMCNIIFELSKNLKENNLGFKIEKEKKEETEEWQEVELVKH